MLFALIQWLVIAVGAAGGVITGRFYAASRGKVQGQEQLFLFLSQYLGLTLLFVMPLAGLAAVLSVPRDGMAAYWTGASVFAVALVLTVAFMDDDRRKRWKKKASRALQELLAKVQAALAPPEGLARPVPA